MLGLPMRKPVSTMILLMVSSRSLRYKVGSDSTATRTVRWSTNKCSNHSYSTVRVSIPYLFKQDVGKHTSLPTHYLTTTSTMSPRRCQHRKSLRCPQGAALRRPASALAQRGAPAFAVPVPVLVSGRARSYCRIIDRGEAKDAKEPERRINSCD